MPPTAQPNCRERCTAGLSMPERVVLELFSTDFIPITRCQFIFPLVRCNLARDRIPMAVMKPALCVGMAFSAIQPYQHVAIRLPSGQIQLEHMIPNT